jgi:UDP-N-acetylmuramoylalanine--D-glutamate ligase
VQRRSDTPPWSDRHALGTRSRLRGDTVGPPRGWVGARDGTGPAATPAARWQATALVEARRVLVLGMARSGSAAAAALEARGAEVVRVDRKLGNDTDISLLDGVELLVKSPGVPGEGRLVVEARRRGIPVWSEVELGYRLLGATPIVGVTGTNGKTTTVELLGAIFRAAGRDVVVAGNVGTPLTAVSEADWVVCELSSFQLEDVHELRLRVAVLLNLEPDHLDRHGTYEAYRDAKLRIFERAETAIVPRGLGLPGLEFAADDPLPAEPLIPGLHNRENAAAATAAARAAGIDDDAIAAGLRTFPGVEHRLELVRELGGVRFVNDSKATNVAAARRGIAAYDAPLRLILGGSRKGESFEPLARALGPNVRSVHLIGETAAELAQALDAAGVSSEPAGDLETAVAAAAREAEPGDVVLLSPACASYDQFENFERRGEEFRRLVQNLEE